MSELLIRAGRCLSRYAVFIVLGWAVAAVAGNVAVPQLESVVVSHSQSFMPDDAPSSIAALRSAEIAGERPSNNLNYVVFERDHSLQEPDRHYYEALVAELRADTEHVYSVTDLWTDPLTESIAQSDDGQAVNLMVRLAGMLGTSAANDSITAVRDTATRLGAPDGLRVFVTGPGASIVDEYAAIDKQMLIITTATIAVILLLLLAVYRSVVAAAIPLGSVGLALAVGRALVAVLGSHGIVEVSLFTVALIAAMVLGAGTDYAIFLVGRYHEGRRAGLDAAAALATAYRGVAPVIVASALTMAAALSCLSFAEVGMFRSVGVPCAIGILTAMAAALTVTPALISLAGRRGLLEPRRSTIARRWRRAGVTVARWPAPVWAVSAALIALLMLPVATMNTGWNEPAEIPAGTESNQGYRAADQHFLPNQLFPNVVLVEADHQLRNPAGLIAIERISRQLMAIPGVRMVQSASRPAGSVPNEATWSYQGGIASSKLDAGVDSLTERLQAVNNIDTAVSRLAGAVDQLERGMQNGTAAMREITAGGIDMRSGMDGVQTSAEVLSGYLDPLRTFVDTTPDCPTNPICSLATQIIDPIDGAIAGSGELADGAAKVTSGSASTTAVLASLPQTLESMRGVLNQAKTATQELLDAAGSIAPQMRQATDYLHEIETNFKDSAAGDFYLPSQALTDPEIRCGT